MGRLITFVILTLLGVGSIIFVANSTNKSEKMQDIISKFPTIAPTTPPFFPTAIQPPVTSTPTPVEKIATISAVMKTTKGDITLALYTKNAPNTVANFLNKAKTGFYKNLTFHRVEDWVVQGGDPKGDGSGGGAMFTEINGLPFVAGSLGVARGKDLRISNDAQFFIVKKDADSLFTQYTNFGTVTNGMDVVNKLEVGDKILEITVQ